MAHSSEPEPGKIIPQAAIRNLPPKAVKTLGPSFSQ
jgi:hypothetical protein